MMPNYTVDPSRLALHVVVVYFNLFWFTLVYFGLVWSTLIYFGLLWSTLVYFGLLWSTGGLLWFTLVFLLSLVYLFASVHPRYTKPATVPVTAHLCVPVLVYCTCGFCSAARSTVVASNENA